MQDLLEGLDGSDLLSDSQSATLLRYVKSWLGSDLRKYQYDSQQYYEGKQDIFNKKRRFFDGKTGKMENYPDTIPNTQLVDNLFRRIVDLKTKTVSERKLKFIPLPSHRVDFNDPSSIEQNTVGDVEPTGGYSTEKVEDVSLVKSDGTKERKREKGFLSTLDQLFNEDWYVELNRAIKYAIIDGQCWLFPYKHKNGLFKVRVFRGRDILPIYTDETATELAAVVRWYEDPFIDVDGQRPQYIEVYRKSNMIRYQLHSRVVNDKASEVIGMSAGIVSNYIRYDIAADAPSPKHLTYSWDEIPFVPLVSSDPVEPMISRCKTLIDELNLAYSNWGDCCKMFPDDGILIVTNARGTRDDELWQKVSQNRVLSVISTPEAPGGDAKFLESPLKGEEHLLYTDKITQLVYQNCAAFDDSNPNILSSHLQELTLRMTMMSMEQDATTLIRSIERGLAHLIRKYFIPYLVMKGFDNYSDVSFAVKFEETQRRNVAEAINLAVSMGAKMSLRTILEHLPWVDDVDEELERIDHETNKMLLLQQKQMQDQMDMQQAAQQETMKFQMNQQAAQQNQMNRQKPMGVSSGTSSSVNTGSPNGGGKGADFMKAKERQDAKNSDPGHKTQPQR